MLTESLIRELGTADIQYAGIEFLEINLGTSSDRLDFDVANSSTTRTTVRGGSGDEQVFIHSLAKLTDSATGNPIVTATINGEAGVDRVTVVIPGNPNLLAANEFANLGFAVEELRIDNTQNTTATANWLLKNSSGGAQVFVVNGSTETKILDTLGAETTIFDAGGAVGTDRLTVRDDVDAPQKISVEGTHIEVEEGANVLFFDSNTPFDGFQFNATIDGLDGASDVAVAPAGDYVYVTGKVDDAVLVLRRTANSNRLEYVQVIRDGQFNVDGLDGASSIVISPDATGSHVYVGSETDQAVAIFERVPQTGRLVFRGKFTNANVGAITHLAISPNGANLYGTTTANDIFRLAVSSPTSLAFGEKRSALTTGYTGIAVGLDGQNVFTSSNSQLSQLFVGSSGVLPTSVTSSSSVAYRDVAAGPGNTVYGAFDGGIRVFRYTNSGLGAAIDTENWVNATNLAQATAVAVDADSGRVVASFDDTSVNPNPDTFQLQLISLYHIYGQDKFDGLTFDDEIYVEVNGTRIFGPSTFTVNGAFSDDAETRDLTTVAPVTISGSATVKLWEQDDGQGDELLVNNDDLLGSRTVTTPTTGDSDSYTISWAVQDSVTKDISQAILTFEVRRIAGSTPTTEPVLTFVRNSSSGTLSSPHQVTFNDANKLDALAVSAVNSDFYGTNASGDFLALFSGAGTSAAFQQPKLTDGTVQNGLEYRAQLGPDDVETVISPDGKHAYSISGKYGLIMLATRDASHRRIAVRERRNAVPADSGRVAGRRRSGHQSRHRHQSRRQVRLRVEPRRRFAAGVLAQCHKRPAHARPGLHRRAQRGRRPERSQQHRGERGVARARCLRGGGGGECHQPLFTGVWREQSQLSEHGDDVGPEGTECDRAGLVGVERRFRPFVYLRHQRSEQQGAGLRPRFEREPQPPARPDCDGRVGWRRRTRAARGDRAEQRLPADECVRGRPG